MGKKVRKSAEKRREKKQAEEEALIIEEAKKIAAAIGLQINFESTYSCGHCIIGLSRIIVECGRNKGLIFHRLHRIGEGVFSNCGGELKGRAFYKDKVYEVDENGYVVELNERGENAYSVLLEI